MIARNRDSIVLAGVVLLIVILFGRIDHSVPPFDSWDLVAYLKMAEAAPGIADGVNLPYASRLLGPMLAGLGPLSEPIMFRILTVVTGVALTLALHRFLLARGVGAGAALAATVMFVLNKQFFGFNIWNHFQLNDMLAMLLLVALFEAMIAGRWLLFGVWLLLGAMARESTMLAIPAACLMLWDEGRLRKEGPAFLVATVPGVGLLIFLKLVLPARDFTLLGAFGHYSVKAGAWRTWFYLFVNSVAPLTFVPFIFWSRTVAFFRARRFALVFVILVAVSAFFGSNNERLMAPVFIVFYWLIADILQSRFTGPRGRWFLAACAMAATFHQTYTRFDFMAKPAAVGLTLGSLLLVTGFSIMFVIRRMGEAR